MSISAASATKSKSSMCPKGCNGASVKALIPQGSEPTLAIAKFLRFHIFHLFACLCLAIKRMIWASARHAAPVCLKPLLSLLPRHLAYGKHTRLWAPAISKGMLCAISSQNTTILGDFHTKWSCVVWAQLCTWEVSQQSFLSPKEVQVIEDTMPRCLQLCLCNHRFTAKPVCLVTNSIFIKRKKTQECWGMLKRGFQLQWNKRWDEFWTQCATVSPGCHQTSKLGWVLFFLSASGPEGECCG